MADGYFYQGEIMLIINDELEFSTYTDVWVLRENMHGGLEIKRAGGKWHLIEEQNEELQIHKIEEPKEVND